MEQLSQTIALHTRLLPGRERDYDRIHSRIGDELAEKLRDSGVTDWRIWRSGLELFHLVEVENYADMRTTLAADPVNMVWQSRMAELLEVEDDYSGTDTGIQQVWGLQRDNG